MNEIRTSAVYWVTIASFLLSFGCSPMQPVTPEVKPPTEEVAEQQPPIPEVKYFTHKIKWSGENIMRISRWYTGSGRNWPRIVEANPSIDPRRMRIGDSILIPEELMKTTKPMPKSYRVPASSSKSKKGESASKPLPASGEPQKAEPASDLVPASVETQDVEPASDLVPASVETQKIEPSSDLVPASVETQKAEPSSDLVPASVETQKAEPASDLVPASVETQDVEPASDLVPASGETLNVEPASDLVPAASETQKPEAASKPLPGGGEVELFGPLDIQSQGDSVEGTDTSLPLETIE